MIRDFDLNELPSNEDNMDLDGVSSNINPHGHIGGSPTKEGCDNEAVYLVSSGTDPNLPIKEEESPQFHEDNVIAFNGEATTSSAAIPHEDTPSHEGQDEASSINKEHDEGGIFSLATGVDVPIEEDELPQLVNDKSSSSSPHERLDGDTTIKEEDDKSDAEERNTTMPIQEQNVQQILINENVVSTSSSSNVSKPRNNTLSCEVTTTEDEDRESSKGGISLNASATHPIDPMEENESPKVATNDKAIEIKVSRSSESYLSCEKMSSEDGDKEKSRGDSEERNATMPIQEQNVPQILINENVVSTSSSSTISKPWNNTLSCEVTTTEDEDRESSKGGISLKVNATHPIDPVEEHESPQVAINDKAIETKVARSSKSSLSYEKMSSEDGDQEKSRCDSEDANMDTNEKIEDRSLKRKRVEASSTGTHSNVYGSQPVVLQGVQRASRISGFIFLCTMSTIQDCRKYSVFGLKDYRIQAVEKIKAGTYLFLFDCHSKFLHGIYMATTNGAMNLEPNAFGGRYPAQVKFTTHLLCPALPESAFKGFITHHGNSKFRQELSKDQVDSLISLFTKKRLASPLSSNPQPPRGIENRSVPESEFANDYYYKKPAALDASLHERTLASSEFTMPSHLGANFQFSSHRAANMVRPPAFEASSHARPLGPPTFPVPSSHVGANFQFLSNRGGELVKLTSERPNQVGFGPHSMLPMGHAGLGGNYDSVSNLGAPPPPRNPWHLQNEKRF